MRIVGIEGMTVSEIEQAVSRGGRFVVFEYCVSVLILTFKRSSDVHFIKPGESAIRRGLDCTATTLLFGWWGIPWGPIFSVMALCTNLGGGRDVTAAMMAELWRGVGAPAPAPSYRDAPTRAGYQPQAVGPGPALGPAIAILTASGRLRCPACGHEGSPSRKSCKQCRTPLLKAPPAWSAAARPLPPCHSVSPSPWPAVTSGATPQALAASLPNRAVAMGTSSDPHPTPPLGTVSPMAATWPTEVVPTGAPPPARHPSSR